MLDKSKIFHTMDDDEALVFRVKQNWKGEDQFEIVTDDEMIDAVFKEYNRLLMEATNK